MPAYTQFAIVFNPTAGRRRAERVSRTVADQLRCMGHDVERLASSAPGDVERITRDLVSRRSDDRPLCVVACGGDGTIHEVVNALAHVDHPHVTLGVAPAGRCNDFAKALGINTAPDHVAQTLGSGQRLPMDLGRAGNRFFCTIAALGFDAAVTRFVNDMKMPLRGTSAYVYGTLRVLATYQTPVLRLSGDFGVYEGPVFFAASANTSTYGGAMRVAPNASCFDGLLDVCLVSRISKRRVLRLLPRVIHGRHLGWPEVRILRTAQLAVTPIDGPAPEIWADGEFIGTAPVTISAARHAIYVMHPPDARQGSGSGQPVIVRSHR